MRVTLKRMIRLAIEDSRKEHQELACRLNREVEAKWEALEAKEAELIKKLSKDKRVVALHKAQAALETDSFDVNVCHHTNPPSIRVGLYTSKVLKYPEELIDEYKAIVKLREDSQRASCPDYFEESAVEDSILRATINEDLDQKQQFALVRSTIEELSFPERAKQIASKETK